MAAPIWNELALLNGFELGYEISTQLKVKITDHPTYSPARLWIFHTNLNILTLLLLRISFAQFLISPKAG